MTELPRSPTSTLCDEGPIIVQACAALCTVLALTETRAVLSDSQLDSALWLIAERLSHVADLLERWQAEQDL
jgi:hypothetical protein